MRFGLTARQRLPEEDVLAAEVAEERDLVDPGGGRDAARRSSVVAAFGVHLQRGRHELFLHLHERMYRKEELALQAGTYKQCFSGGRTH